ncbi:helicase HerA-like domain-containing protein [Methylocystis sp. 9N]|uniref:Helicase HerA-like domain-containing protein n=1 Tax=Methylocystis borbori TaxID=3118750 RepID=A0ABU7XFJ2_9HYPH
MSDNPNDVPGKILVGASATGEKLFQYRYLSLALGNRHGLIAGATGGGKTVSLQRLAEGFSNAGTAVFLADVKGDLAGLSQPGDAKPAFVARAKEIGVPYAPDRFPVVFWDVFGEQGHPVRATVSEMGPLLLSRLLDLNDTQEGVLNIVFKAADEQGMLLLDLKDLRAMLTHVAENAATYKAKYGNVAPASVGAIQRQLLVLETQGGENFFGEPALDIMDFLRVDRDGRGVVNILAADKLMRAPRLYATFLLWMLSELFERLPEVGDLDKPKLVFFFDEAHLLFEDAPKALLSAIEQVVRLIRSKGVGVYLVTQNPLDLPDTVLGQLGNRIQHVLRAFTPREQKAVRAAAETFRDNPKIDEADVIMHLGVGEALVSMLDAKGAPEVVERALIAPPAARVGPITPEERKAILAASALAGKYDTMFDRESAFELLQARAGKGDSGEAAGGGLLGTLGGVLGSIFGRADRKRMSPAELAARAAIQSAARSAGTQIARQILRGVLGGMSK